MHHMIIHVGFLCSFMAMSAIAQKFGMNTSIYYRSKWIYSDSYIEYLNDTIVDIEITVPGAISSKNYNANYSTLIHSFYAAQNQRVACDASQNTINVYYNLTSNHFNITQFARNHRQWVLFDNVSSSSIEYPIDLNVLSHMPINGTRDESLSILNRYIQNQTYCCGNEDLTPCIRQTCVRNGKKTWFMHLLNTTKVDYREHKFTGFYQAQPEIANSIYHFVTGMCSSDEANNTQHDIPLVELQHICEKNQNQMAIEKLEYVSSWNNNTYIHDVDWQLVHLLFKNTQKNNIGVNASGIANILFKKITETPSDLNTNNKTDVVIPLISRTDSAQLCLPMRDGFPVPESRQVFASSLNHTLELAKCQSEYAIELSIKEIQLLYAKSYSTPPIDLTMYYWSQNKTTHISIFHDHSNRSVRFDNRLSNGTYITLARSLAGFNSTTNTKTKVADSLNLLLKNQIYVVFRLFENSTTTVTLPLLSFVFSLKIIPSRFHYACLCTGTIPTPTLTPPTHLPSFTPTSEMNPPTLPPSSAPVTSTLIPTPVTNTLIPTPSSTPVTNTLIPTPSPAPATNTLIPTPSPAPVTNTPSPLPSPTPAINTHIPTPGTLSPIQTQPPPTNHAETTPTITPNLSPLTLNDTTTLNTMVPTTAVIPSQPSIAQTTAESSSKKTTTAIVISSIVGIVFIIVTIIIIITVRKKRTTLTNIPPIPTASQTPPQNNGVYFSIIYTDTPPKPVVYSQLGDAQLPANRPWYVKFTPSQR